MTMPQTIPNDEALYDKSKAEGGELFATEVVGHLFVGEGPIRVYRTYCGMTQKPLTEATTVDPAYLS